MSSSSLSASGTLGDFLFDDFFGDLVFLLDGFMAFLVGGGDRTVSCFFSTGYLSYIGMTSFFFLEIRLYGFQVFLFKRFTIWG